MKKPTIYVLMLTLGFLAVAYAATSVSLAGESSPGKSLAGVWHGKVQFSSGAFSVVKDLETQYAFHADGTMNESSNYDGAPPVPPAYGIWRKIKPRQYEAKYEFFATQAPQSFDDIRNGGGWLPAGKGVIIETITLSDDGNSFDSTVSYDAFDQAGKRIGTGGEGKGNAERIRF